MEQELSAWVNKTTGEIRIFHPVRSPEGYSVETHDLIHPAPPELFDGMHDWDAATRAPVPVLPAADQVIIDRLEQGAEQASIETIPRLGRQIAIDRAWQEIQRFKMFQAINAMPTQDAQLRRQFPTLYALTIISSQTLDAVVQQWEPLLWPSVRRNALWQAKLMAAQLSVKQAGTIAEKLAAANNVTWTEGTTP